MNKGLAALLAILALVTIVLPWRYGPVWVTAPGIVLALFALWGLMRDDGDEARVDPFLRRHAVTLLVVAGFMSVLGIAGALRECAAKPMEDPGREPSRDYIRERAKTPASAHPERALPPEPRVTL
jgi:hypothetical protein